MGSNIRNNRALFIESPGQLAVKDISLPKELEQEDTLKPGDVLVEVKYVGICGSDLSLIRHGHLAEWTLTEPLILGHEPAGVVVKSNHKLLKVGDAIALEHQIPDGTCRYCKIGRYNLCPASTQRTIGFPPTNGALTHYMVHPGDFCYKLPPSMDLKLGALIQPMAVAIHACKRAGVTMGSNVLVTGAGPVGLLALQVAKAFGAVSVCVTDIVNDRLEMAKDLGADVGVNVKELSPEDAQKRIMEEFDGRGASVTIECSGVAPSIRLAIAVSEPGAKIVATGLGSKDIPIPLAEASMKEIDILGCCRFANCYEDAIAMIAHGRLPNLHKMITHVFPLGQAVEAFDTLLNGKCADGKPAVKVLIQCDA